MPQAIEVECVHLEHELMRVRFAQSQLVSDHPQEWGGTGTGPAPGEMILMALASASALAGRQFAMREKLEVAHVGARANMASVQEGLSGHLSNVALPHLTFGSFREARGFYSVLAHELTHNAVTGDYAAWRCEGMSFCGLAAGRFGII